MAFHLGKSSLAKLAEVHPDLQRLVTRAIELSPVDFCVFEGIRTLERQKALVASGKSRTLKSRHLTGDAVDLVPWIGGKPVWEVDSCRKIAGAMKLSSAELGIPIEWGGDWAGFFDGPHFQRPWGSK